MLLAIEFIIIIIVGMICFFTTYYEEDESNLFQKKFLENNKSCARIKLRLFTDKFQIQTTLLFFVLHLVALFAIYVGFNFRFSFGSIVFYISSVGGAGVSLYIALKCAFIDWKNNAIIFSIDKLMILNYKTGKHEIIEYKNIHSVKIDKLYLYIVTKRNPNNDVYIPLKHLLCSKSYLKKKLSEFLPPHIL